MTKKSGLCVLRHVFELCFYVHVTWQRQNILPKVQMNCTDDQKLTKFIKIGLIFVTFYKCYTSFCVNIYSKLFKTHEARRTL